MDILVKNHFLALFADQEPARAALLLPLAFSDSNGFVQETGTQKFHPNFEPQKERSTKIHRLFSCHGRTLGGALEVPLTFTGSFSKSTRAALGFSVEVEREWSSCLMPWWWRRPTESSCGESIWPFKRTQHILKLSLSFRFSLRTQMGTSSGDCPCNTRPNLDTLQDFCSCFVYIYPQLWQKIKVWKYLFLILNSPSPF